jgi:transcriptional regulator with XRE-family HTH domain
LNAQRGHGARGSAATSAWYLVMNIGERVKKRRTELGLSLRELGELTQLTAGFLSQVENDQVSPSLNSLQTISTALRVPMFYFLNTPQSAPVVRAGERKKLYFPDSQIEYDLLVADLNRQMMPVLIRMDPLTTRNALPLAAPTEQWMYVLRGDMQLTINEQTYTLSENDSIYFDGDRLIEFSSISDEPLEILCCITPPLL